MSNIEEQIGHAADYVATQVTEAAEFVATKLDTVVDGVTDVLSGPSGRKVVGGAVVGAVAAVVLPVSLGAGALLGAGYAAFRQLGREPHPMPERPAHPSHPTAEHPARPLHETGPIES